MAQQLTNPTSIYEDAGSIPGPNQPVKDLAFCELWCMSQMQLGSDVTVAVVQAGSATPFRPLAWESLYAASAALKRQKKKKDYFLYH